VELEHLKIKTTLIDEMFAKMETIRLRMGWLSPPRLGIEPSSDSLERFFFKNSTSTSPVVV
jgi:hypothetical protein